MIVVVTVQAVVIVKTVIVSEPSAAEMASVMCDAEAMRTAILTKSKVVAANTFHATAAKAAHVAGTKATHVVATKAACQVASHFVKLIYFGGIIDQAATLDPVLAGVAVAASMTGTTLARRFLEAMTDLQFRTWATRLITTVASYYIIYGSWLLLARSNALALD